MPDQSSNIPDYIPRHSSSNILQYTLVAVNALQDVSDITQIPFLRSVCTMSASIISLVQDIRSRRDRNLRMVEDMHRVLCILMALCTHAEIMSSPQMLRQIVEYADTLQKFYACLRGQTELGTIKRFFKHGEITAQLDLCESRLKVASEVLSTQYGVGIASTLLQMDIDTEQRHQELLELISARSESFSTTASSIRGSSFARYDEPEVEEEQALDELLVLSGSLPLAVSLMANIASFEGYTNTLSRWKLENTSLLSEGNDKRSNLEMSIILSLGSPRISSSPQARSLLSLLSILPDGITDSDMIASNVPLDNIARCKSALVQTSLAYIGVGGRLKALCPIREFIRRVHPPSLSLSKPLRGYFQELLRIWDAHQQLPSGDLVPKLMGYLGNIDGLLLQGLNDDQSAWKDIAHSILTFSSFSSAMLKGNSQLIQKLPGLIEATGDAHLRWSYVCVRLRNRISSVGNTNTELLITEGIQYFTTVQCHIDEAAEYYGRQAKFPEAIKLSDLALVMGQKTNNSVLRFESLDVKLNIAHSLRDAQEVLKLVYRARICWGLPSNMLEEYWMLFFEAFAYNELGNHSHALHICSIAIELLVANGMQDAYLHLGILDIQAEIHFRKSEYSQAHEIQTVVAAKTSPIRSPRFHANALANLAYLDIAMSGDEAQILQNLNGAAAVYRDLGVQRTLCTWVMAELYLYRGDTQNARVTFETCLSQSRGRFYDIEALCTAALADPKHMIYDPHITFRQAVIYLALMLKRKDRVGTFRAFRCLAGIYCILEDEDMSLNLYHIALEGATEMDIHRLRAECMTGIGDIMIQCGDVVQAKEMWKAAQSLFARSSQKKDVVAINTRLAQLLNDTEIIGGVEKLRLDLALRISPSLANSTITKNIS
ncbi:hypothetical protein B0H17DRAFT_1146271 [Mycena rosella]|uniref:Uncharacterized protein n=1 Tax=Mycena rosella TaxID=1033263 RepID=A0AAD7CPZ3_MYCRO|nr:hypothetical protein B0H17DRAFT_1146271 [Mycena rosella]